MAKEKTVFLCGECGYESPRWMGKCPACGAWNTMVEEAVVSVRDPQQRGSVQRLSDVSAMHAARVSTGMSELDRVTGGGLLAGMVVLLGGDPGIGKSTLLMQAADCLAGKGAVLYVSGEESAAQLKLRADRLQVQNDMLLLCDTSLEHALEQARAQKADFLIVDSIQTICTEESESAPGSVSQVRLCGNKLMKIGKTGNIPILIVAHVTKSGDLAGPKTVEHLVDCVLNFSGERDQELRILRSFKNRFGTTSEIGAFTMGEGGLLEVSDISGTFLESNAGEAEGSVTAAIYEGSRPVMFEVQALVTPANVGFARRTAVGADNTRLSMILAVLEKKAGLKLINQDVYVNIVGGLRPEGTAVDLAIALAIYSSYSNRPSAAKTLAIGEIGLTGDLRAVRNADKIFHEAVRLGYEKVIMPRSNLKQIKNAAAGSCRAIGAGNIREAMAAFGNRD